MSNSSSPPSVTSQLIELSHQLGREDRKLVFVRVHSDVNFNTPARKPLRSRRKLDYA